jgi:hypothetical protein
VKILRWGRVGTIKLSTILFCRIVLAVLVLSNRKRSCNARPETGTRKPLGRRPAGVISADMAGGVWDSHGERSSAAKHSNACSIVTD